MSTHAEQQRFSLRSWVFLSGVILLLILAVLQMRYRLTLPSDGQNFYDEPSIGLDYSQGTQLVAVEGIPAETIILNAVLLRPQRPANSQLHTTVQYRCKVNQTHASTGPRTLHPGAAWESGWETSYWVITIAQLFTFGIRLFVFGQRPLSSVSHFLLLFGLFTLIPTLAHAPTNGWGNIRVTDYFYVLAYWPTLFFGNGLALAFASLWLILLTYPQLKKPMHQHPALVISLIYGLALLPMGSSAGLPFGQIGLVVGNGAILLILGGMIITAAHTFFTQRTPIQRAQVRWLIWPTILLGVNILLLFVTWGLSSLAEYLHAWELYQTLNKISEPLFGLFLYWILLLPVALVIGIWRDRLFDIELWLNRAVVYVALTATLVGLYILLIGGLSLLFHNADSFVLSLLATGGVAVLFQPLQARIQQTINRALYGQWDDPMGVLTQLGQHLEQANAPETILQVFVSTIAAALKLPYVALWTKTEESRYDPIAVVGTHPDQVEMTPLYYQSEQIGQLVVAPRTPGTHFSRAETELLQTIAELTDTPLTAVQLHQELQQSRQNIITTREEERRRIRRDLHDGLGPQLAALTFKVDAARNQLQRNAPEAESLLHQVNRDLQETIQDVRRLVHDLRPPALDQLGLVSALQEYAAAHSQNGLHITVTASQPLPNLPAAAEVALYRIASEAMTNVVRHARATHCQVHLTLNNSLNLEVRDDGQGFAPGNKTGVGLASMQERAAELGGIFVVDSQPGKGTVIRVQLPLKTKVETV